MDQNELHAVSLLLRGASKTLIIIDEKNPATYYLAEAFVALISSQHNTPYVIAQNTITQPLLTYTTTSNFPTSFITTIKNTGNILASQENNTLTLTTTTKPKIITTYPCDCIIILTSVPYSESSFLKNNPDLLQNIPSILVANESYLPYTATHLITNNTKNTLAQTCLELFESLAFEITERIATALLASLYLETNFIAKPLHKETLHTASILLEKNAVHEQIMKTLLRNKTIEELSQLGKLYTDMIHDEKTGIAHTTLPTTKKLGATAAQEIFTSLPSIHLVVLPDITNPHNTYHVWCDTTHSLTNLLHNREGQIEKEYANITITEDLPTFLNYLQKRIESA